MLSLIRRAVNSKVGVVITLGVLAVIALMFGMGDITGLGGSGRVSGDSVVKVGKMEISEIALRERAQNQLDALRREQPTIDMVQFVNQGGLDSTLNRSIDILAFQEFAQRQGLVASKRLIDGRIASLPGVRGFDGNFSQSAYEQFLARNRLTDKQVRSDLLSETMAQFVVVPASEGYVSVKVATPFASLLLEKRDGQVAFIPTPAMGKGAPPTDAELAAFYKRNLARYTVPERRIVRYATVTMDAIKASAIPTEAEIAKGYELQKKKFQATEKRDIVQVVVPGQAAANALVAKAKTGSLEEAARAGGFEPNTLKGAEKPAYTTANSPEIANAAFAAAKGAVLGPFRTALGFTVLRVDGIEKVEAKSLEQARPELIAQISAEKAVALMQTRRDAIDNAIGNGSTFDEIIADQKLTAANSVPLTAAGLNPDDPASKPDPAFAQALIAAFAAEQGDDPQLVPAGEDGSFSVVSLARVVPAAPRQLAQIREKIASDFVIDRAQRLARQAAVEVTARVNKGMPLAQSIAETKLGIPGPQPVPPIARGQIENAGAQVPPAITLMFSMTEKKARMIEAPNKSGWLIVYLNHIERGNAAGQKPVIDRARAQIGQTIGREYIQQLTEAVRRSVGVKKNDKAIGVVRAALTGQGGSN
ncbi:MAG: peptidyl-prolyl cis-trans isomerase [Sphingomonas sp.]|jgi:peptidyl-prolyl cis-trans isomerase D|uniref:peptidylprolyl isomerase n=1 Tax=Sphingomonas sp. TaxID=28214 RepID=UPI003566E96E